MIHKVKVKQEVLNDINKHLEYLKSQGKTIDDELKKLLNNKDGVVTLMVRE